MKNTLSNLVNLIKQKIRWANAPALAMSIAKLDGKELDYSDLVSAIMQADVSLRSGIVDEVIDILELEGVLIPSSMLGDMAASYAVNLAAVNEGVKKK